MHDEEFIVNTPKGDYTVSITHDCEEDNVKAWTEVISPDGRFAHLDITPYSPERNLIRRMIRFHSMFGYWVTRQMVESGGPVEMGTPSSASSTETAPTSNFTGSEH